MKNHELREKLAKHPDDMEVTVVDELFGDLDRDLEVDTALDFSPSGGRPDGRRSWRWESEQYKLKLAPEGAVRVLVVY